MEAVARLVSPEFVWLVAEGGWRGALRLVGARAGVGSAGKGQAHGWVGGGLAGWDYRSGGGTGGGSLGGVTLRLHDTATRSEREFSPVEPGKASLYLCGATVQAPPHIGHIRSGVSFDILVRWLRFSGYQVTFCRNVTDIDDKILRVAAAERGGLVGRVAAQRARVQPRLRRARLPSAGGRTAGHRPHPGDDHADAPADRRGARLRLGRRRVLRRPLLAGLWRPVRAAP